MENGKPHTIASSLEHVHSSKTVTPHQQAKPQRSKMLALILSRLAIHYYRPDFTEGQAKLLIEDMVQDLGEFNTDIVTEACSAYRQRKDSKFFPTSGVLRALCNEIEQASAKAAREAARGTARPAQGFRPNLWWMQPREKWNRGWSESDVPMGEKIKHHGNHGKMRDPERIVL